MRLCKILLTSALGASLIFSALVNAASIASLSTSAIRYDLGGTVGSTSNIWDQFNYSSLLMADASTGPVTWSAGPDSAVSSDGRLYSAGSLVAGVDINSFTVDASVYSEIDITGPKAETQRTSSQSTFGWNFDVVEPASLVIEIDIIELFGSGNASMSLSHCFLGAACSKFLDIDVSQARQTLTVEPDAGFWRLSGEINTSYGSRGPLTATGGAAWDVTVSTVPVPAAVWLFSSGLLGLIGIAKRKKIA